MYCVVMKSNIIQLGSEIITPLSANQAATEDRLECGLDYPVQGRGLRSGKFILPIWTDGDGVFFAIARNGETISL